MKKTGIILGSGWPLPAGLTITQTLPLSAAYPIAEADTLQEVAGHRNQILLGHLQNQPVVVIGGRRHLYQGYTARYVAHTVLWLQQQGVTRVILTNAAGGVNPQFEPGDLMLVTDHVNLTGDNPLQASQPGQPVTFVDVSQIYRRAWIDQTLAVPTSLIVRQGIYAGVRGPSYETPAEVRMLQMLGVDAVGMSTVLEALQACALGLPVLGVSLIANAASGLSAQTLNHQDVLAQVQAQQAALSQWLADVVLNTAL